MLDKHAELASETTFITRTPSRWTALQCMVDLSENVNEDDIVELGYEIVCCMRMEAQFNFAGKKLTNVFHAAAYRGRTKVMKMLLETISEMVNITIYTYIHMYVYVYMYICIYVCMYPRLRQQPATALGDWISMKNH